MNERKITVAMVEAYDRKLKEDEHAARRGRNTCAASVPLPYGWTARQSQKKP